MKHYPIYFDYTELYFAVNIFWLYLYFRKYNIRRLFTDLKTTSDLQKPDKILLDNPNLIHTLSSVEPEIGTVRESFFCNQLAGAGQRLEYSGIATGDFKIDRNIVVEVGGEDKGFRQVKGEEKGYVAADDIDSAISRKIPLWLFEFLY